MINSERNDAEGMSHDELDRALRNAIGYYSRPDISRVRELLLEGANPNAIKTDDDPPLHCAALATSDRIEVALMLLQAGALIDARNHLGVTALHSALLQGDAHLAQLLLDRGACIDNSDEATVKTAASAVRYPEVMRLLLDRGMDANLRNNSGASLLHFAVAAESAETVRMLLERGANPNYRNSRGDTPIDLASMVGDPTILMIISEKTGLGYFDGNINVQVRRGTRHWNDEDGTYRINKTKGPTGTSYTKEYIAGPYKGNEFAIHRDDAVRLGEL